MTNEPQIPTLATVTVRTCLLALFSNGSSRTFAAGRWPVLAGDDLSPQHPVGEVGRIERELEAGHHAPAQDVQVHLGLRRRGPAGHALRHLWECGARGGSTRGSVDNKP